LNFFGNTKVVNKVVVFLLLIIILLVGGVAYIAGRSGLVKLPTISINQPGSQSTSTPEASAAPTEKPTKTINGGGILSFPKYSITVPADWEDSREVPGPDSEKIIVKKGQYEISILEGGFGGSICLYPGDPDSEGPSARYTSFIEITTKAADLFRRSWSGSGTGFAICHKTQYGWNAPTLYGHISFKVPTSYTTEMIAEMDAILASFTKR